MKERIAKAIARAGVCSRRQAEELIRAGRVSLNDHTLLTPAINVSTNDSIKVDGKIIPLKEKLRVWIYHKPRGLITTHKDPEGRDTVFHNLPSFLPRVISVGRLDLNSEGLLLLTNSGDLARFLEHPKTRIPRTYRVRVFGSIQLEVIESLRKGITINNIFYGPICVKVQEKQGANHWLILTLYEGKNREIRKIMEYCELSLNRLIRTSYGPFELGSLPPGTVREIAYEDLCAYLSSLGYSYSS
jgi:23S rRNA pseudouridine2605 synthase